MKQFKDFRKKYGPWALIAGGSEGIGGAYADLAKSAAENRRSLLKAIVF